MKTNVRPAPSVNMGFEAVAGKNPKPNNQEDFAQKLESLVSSKDKNPEAVPPKPTKPISTQDKEKIVEELEKLELSDEEMKLAVDFMAHLFMSTQDLSKIEVDAELLGAIKDTVSNAIDSSTQFSTMLQSAAKPVISDYNVMIVEQTIASQLKTVDTDGEIVLPTQLEMVEEMQVNGSVIAQSIVSTDVVTKNTQSLVNQNNTVLSTMVDKVEQTKDHANFTLKVTTSMVSEESDAQTDLGSQTQGQANPNIEIKDFSKLTVGNAQIDGRADFVAQQVTTALKTALVGEKMEFTMQLQPHTLGKLIVKMVMESGKLSVSIVAQNAETQKLLASQISILEQTLKTDNIKIQTFELQNELFNDLSSFGQDSSAQNQKAFKDGHNSKQATSKFSLSGEVQEEDASTESVNVFDANRINISV
ncbi:MAG: flagellar hook-length control protein FliK [Oscillospiraceae bacterium]